MVTLTTETTPLLLPLQLPGLLFCRRIGECLQQQPLLAPERDLRCGVVGGGTARLFDRLREEPGGAAGPPEGEKGESDGSGLSLGEGSALRETVTPLKERDKLNEFGCFRTKPRDQTSYVLVVKLNIS